MKKTLFIIALCATLPLMAANTTMSCIPSHKSAGVSADDEPEPTISDECRKNVSLFHENVRAKQFEIAYEPWMTVYTECPNVNKSVYTDGAKIVDYFYAKAKAENNKEEMTRLANLALEMCDKRIKYFGDDPKYPAAYILGEKGLEYIEHFPEDELKANAYGWLKESISGLQSGSKITVLVEFFKLSYGLYRSNPNQYAEQFIADYTMVNSYLTAIAENPKSKNASAAEQNKGFVDEMFATSGAADCEKMDQLYASYVETNGQNLEKMLNLMSLYKRVNCTESEVYFAAAEKAHQMQPTEESAAGCAKMCYKKEDWKGALKYYQEAVSLIEEADDEDKDDYYYMMALIQMDKLKNYPEARNYARMSLEANPNMGRCYILIGMCYAGTKPYSQAEYGAKAAILNKTVYWAAVDQFIKAKEVDPSCAADANQLIASYSKYFPTKEERFDLPNDFSGTVFIVGGWINERTYIR